MLTLITRKDPPCVNCMKAKYLLKVKAVDYKELDIDENSALIEEYSIRTLPFVLVDGKALGGLNDLAAYLQRT